MPNIEAKLTIVPAPENNRGLTHMLMVSAPDHDTLVGFQYHVADSCLKIGRPAPLQKLLGCEKCPVIRESEYDRVNDMDASPYYGRRSSDETVQIICPVGFSSVGVKLADGHENLPCVRMIGTNGTTVKLPVER